MENPKPGENLNQVPSNSCPHHEEHHRLHGKYSPSRVQNLFFLNGITSLLGWNVILVSFDYFSNIYTNYDPVLYFPIPVFIGYILVSLSFNFLSQKYSYRNLVFAGILINNAMLLMLLFLSITCKQNQAVGFYISLICCFILGVGNNFAQLSFFAMINYFGEHTVSKFTIGTAGSGLMLTILEIIVAAIFGADTTEIAGFATYIGLTIAYNFVDMYLNNKLFKSSFYKKKILDNLSNTQQTVTQSQKSYFRWLWDTIFVVSPYPVMIMVNFIVTFLLYPNLTFIVKTTLSPGWKILMINLMYNIGDFLGKLAGDFRKTFNSYSNKYLLASRLIFFYTIILLVKNIAADDVLLHNDAFIFINVVIFAFTNGFVINGSFILSFETAPNQYKKYAGVLGGIMLQLGIMIGSFLAIPFSILIDPNYIDQ